MIDIEIKKKRLNKAWRSAVRLRYSLMADAEIQSQQEDVNRLLDDQSHNVQLDISKALSGENPWLVS